MDKVDLHVHSTASDGTLTPRNVVSLAAMRGLKAIALTDHDTMAGLQEAGEAGELLGVTVIPGIEVSTAYQGKDIHVIGYFLNPESENLKDYLAWVLATRHTRNERIAEKLRKKGFDISLEALETAHPGAIIGRPHFAEALVELRVVPSVKEAFRRYLGDGRSCYVDRERLSLADGIRLIRDCGGVAVLAHPLQYGFSNAELEKLTEDAVQAGVTGMEIHYPGYTEKDMARLYDLAEKYTLYPTGGSDFHGTTKPDIDIGSSFVPGYMFAMLAASQFR